MALEASRASKDSHKADDEEPTSRGNWENPLEFTLACIGYAIGLGNVWRFPYLVYRNGGGAFLVPYILMVFVIGLPIFFAELFVGQYSGLGPIKAYQHLAPFFHGLGYCTLVVITFVTIYYMVIISWIIFYFVASFTPELGWGHCRHDFNTDRIGEATWSNFGVPRWQLVMCLAVGWLIAFFCLSKGIKSAGKVVYFTALFPYVILTSLLVRGATLPGALNGIWFYISSDWSALLQPAVWGDAASQIFYSFGLACNSLVSFASYSHFKNNCHMDTIIVSLLNVFTSIFAGFAVFAMLGFMAYNLDVDVSDIVQDGPGLAFIAYPEAVLLMPMQHLWAILFFLMMFILGMGSQFGGIEALCTAITDQWPHLRHEHWKVTAGVCLGCFIAGLPMVCDGGVYLFTLLDWHTASWAILLLGIAEVVVISWVYGINRTFANLSEMSMRLRGLVRWYWWSAWMFVTPLASIGVFVFVMTGIGPTKFGDYVFPKWADILGWMIGTCTLLPFVGFVVYHLRRGESLWSLFQTSPYWTSQEAGQQISEDSTSSAAPEKFAGIDNVAFENT